MRLDSAGAERLNAEVSSVGAASGGARDPSRDFDFVVASPGDALDPLLDTHRASPGDAEDIAFLEARRARRR